MAAEAHVESKEIPGVAQAIVDRYGADSLRRLVDMRSAPNYGFVYDRSANRDGTDICGPLCSRHVADNWKRNDGKGWLVIELVEDRYTKSTGGKWVTVTELPTALPVAGEVA